MKKEWLDSFGNFKSLDISAIEKLSDEDKAEYFKALQSDRDDKEIATAKKIKDIEDKAEKTASEIEELNKLKAEFNGLNVAQMKDLVTSVKNIGEEMNRQRDSGSIPGHTFESTIKDKFDRVFGEMTGADAEEIKSFFAKELKGSFKFDVDKATSTYADISPREDLGQVRQGIADLPVRQPRFRSIFRTTPLSTEFYKYLRQATVVRDAQNVAVCSAITSTTKETIVIENIGVKKVKDIIKFCLDFVSDYPFMLSRIRFLIDQSIALKVDQQLLLGTGLGNELNSIDSYASEFSAVNIACDISLSIQAANYIDLIKGMATQIVELGEQGMFDPDTVILNKCDFFILISSLKDANNNYLTAQGVINVSGTWFIDGMRVMWSPIVAQNTCYVIDAKLAEIIDRQVLSLEIATENGTDWENEIASLKGFERLNLFLEPNWQDSFMKCSDVAVAILAITAP